MTAKEIADAFLSELTQDINKGELFVPTLPEVALKVRDVADDDDASIHELTQVIATDAALSARLIHVANSPIMRGSLPTDSLQSAITRMGTKLVRGMVVSFVMEQMFQATADVTDRKLRQLWEHSIQVAAISHALASQFTALRPDQAMLAGLVHDIGSLPILAKAEEFPELLEQEALLDRIIQQLHGRVGKAILDAWNFPPEIATVAADHENLSREVPEVDYVDVVMVANLQEYIGTDHPLAGQDWSRVSAFARVGLNPELSVVDLDETAEEIREMQDMLGKQ